MAKKVNKPRHMTKEYLDRLPGRWTPPHKLFYLALIFLCIFAGVFVVNYIAGEREAAKYASPDEIEVVSIDEYEKDGIDRVKISLRHKDGYKLVEKSSKQTESDYEYRFIFDKETSDEGKLITITFNLSNKTKDFTVTIHGNGKPKRVYTYIADYVIE
ncbi:MAG: hypothetical protein IKA51_03660 [Clostridia bacterium]|nr:hypothetical protein [Clostridia bacterium]